ncbi:MAG: PL29 family lyase N-terminal domain-containing protein [Bacilli bacterium]|nr:PL29 family lyase N-terminal domain-containing protein [Bacilli bacterium]
MSGKLKKIVSAISLVIASVFSVGMSFSFFQKGVQKANAAISNHETHSGGTVLSPQEGEMSLPGGDYYLNEDITFRGNLNIRGDVSICLNGHQMLFSNEFYINVYNDSKLLINDCVGNGQIIFPSSSGDDWNGGITVNSNATLTLNGGYINGVNRNKTIYLQNGSSFVMNGGKVYNRMTSASTDCGAIYNNGGSTSVRGGIIDGNIYTTNVVDLEGYVGDPISIYATFIENSEGQVVANNVGDIKYVNPKNNNCISVIEGTDVKYNYCHTLIVYKANVNVISGVTTQKVLPGQSFDNIVFEAIEGAIMPSSDNIKSYITKKDYVDYSFDFVPTLVFSEDGNTLTMSGTVPNTRGKTTLCVFATKTYEINGVTFDRMITEDMGTANIQYGNYYLTCDFKGDLVISGESNIYLNGYSLNITNNSSVPVNAGETLGIYDKPDNSGIINFCYNNPEPHDINPLFDVYGTLNIYGGQFINPYGIIILANGNDGVKSNVTLYGGIFTEIKEGAIASIYANQYCNSLHITNDTKVGRIFTYNPINASGYIGDPIEMNFIGAISDMTLIARNTISDKITLLNKGYIAKDDEYGNVLARKAYSVKIVLNNASVVSGGTLEQNTLDAIDEVVIKADEGYKLPNSVSSSAGINYVLAEDGLTATISGTPTANVEFNVNSILVEYKITLDTNSGGVVANQVVETIGHELRAESLPNIFWDEGSHTFLGWYTAQEGGEKVTDQILSGDITIYAHWSTNYKVTFDAKGGSVTPEFTYTTDGKLTGLPIADYDESHIFYGWFTEEDEKVTLDTVYTKDTTIYAKYTEVKSIDSIDKTSEGLVDTYTINYSDGTTYVFTVTNGANGTDGQTPFIGENGNWWIGTTDTGTKASGSGSGTDGITPQLRVSGETNEWEVSYNNGTTWTSLGVKATGSTGNGIASIEKISTVGKVDTYRITFTDSSTFEFTVTNGTNGENAKKLEMQINLETNEWEYRYEGDIAWTSTGVKATGASGADGKTPQLKIGEDNYWYVSYDEGATWTSLGVKATGEKGEAGTDGITPQLRINAETKYWEVSYDNGISWNSLGVKATSEGSGSGVDGITPKLRINSETNEWEVSYDNGATWTSLGVKATGEDGKDYTVTTVVSCSSALLVALLSCGVTLITIKDRKSILRKIRDLSDLGK